MIAVSLEVRTTLDRIGVLEGQLELKVESRALEGKTFHLYSN